MQENIWYLQLLSWTITIDSINKIKAINLINKWTTGSCFMRESDLLWNCPAAAPFPAPELLLRWPLLYRLDCTSQSGCANSHCLKDWDFYDPYIVMLDWFPKVNWCTKIELKILQLALAKIAQIGRHGTINIRSEHYSPKVMGSIPDRSNFFAEFILL